MWAMTSAGRLIAAYVIVCWIVAPVTLLRLVYLRRFLLRMPLVVRFHGRAPRSSIHSIASQISVWTYRAGAIHAIDLAADNL